MMTMTIRNNLQQNMNNSNVRLTGRDNGVWIRIPGLLLGILSELLLKYNVKTPIGKILSELSHIVKTTFDESVMVNMRCATRGQMLSRVSLSPDS